MMRKGPYARERFVRNRENLKPFAQRYLELYPIDKFETEVESSRHLPPDGIELIIRRLKWPNL